MNIFWNPEEQKKGSEFCNSTTFYYNAASM